MLTSSELTLFTSIDRTMVVNLFLPTAEVTADLDDRVV